MRSSVILLVFFGLAACSADLVLSDDVQVRCGGGQTCPPDFACRGEVAVCVPTNVEDSEAPGLVEPAEITPEQIVAGLQVIRAMAEAEKTGRTIPISECGSEDDTCSRRLVPNELCRELSRQQAFA